MSSVLIISKLEQCKTDFYGPTAASLPHDPVDQCLFQPLTGEKVLLHLNEYFAFCFSIRRNCSEESKDHGKSIEGISNRH